MSFPEIKTDELPKGYQVGDKIKFSMDLDRSGNAEFYAKAKPDKKKG